MPQSSRKRFPAASTWCIDPVTVCAAPQKVSFMWTTLNYTMRRLFLFLISGVVFAQAPPVLSDPLAWAADGAQFVARRGTELVVYDARTQMTRTLANTEAVDKAARERAAAAEPEPFQWENRHVSEAEV